MFEKANLYLFMFFAYTLEQLDLYFVWEFNTKLNLKGYN